MLEKINDSSIRSVFALLFVNLFVFEYAPPFLAGLFVTPVSTVGCLAVSAVSIFAESTC